MEVTVSRGNACGVCPSLGKGLLLTSPSLDGRARGGGKDTLSHNVYFHPSQECALSGLIPLSPFLLRGEGGIQEKAFVRELPLSSQERGPGGEVAPPVRRNTFPIPPEWQPLPATGRREPPHRIIDDPDCIGTHRRLSLLPKNLS